MPTPPSGGQCRLCARPFRKSGMTTHLAAACLSCGSPAKWVSRGPEDWIAMTAGVCDQCVPNLDLDWRLPIINSPRCGVCGYDGEPLLIAQPIAGADDDE